MTVDALFIVPGNAKGIYQDLSNDYSAIEPPTWALLLSESCRSVGFSVDIIDANAEGLTHQQTLDRIITLSPRFIVFVVYGQNVNAGTTGMSGATALSNFIKSEKSHYPIIYIGSHVQALPVDTLEKESSIDIVCTNEGVYALRNLLKIKKINLISLSKVKGIGYRGLDGVKLTAAEIVVPQERMDIDLPGYAWDLLPYNERPFDLYRSPMWHAEYDFNKRSPYATIQTALGCQFKCNFCMINMINRSDNKEIGVASDYSLMRYWSTDFIIKEFDKLLDMGVKTIRIVDEMFLLNPKYYLPICKKLAERNKDDSLRMWAYSRVDTIKRPGILELVRSAGIKWLALGIESAEKSIRLEVSKGKFDDVNIHEVVRKVHEAGIEVMANYMFGLTGDTQESMEKTYNLSEDLCTSGWNAYAVMALPGSAVYKSAVDKGYRLPDTYEDYSFHSYNSLPLPTKNLTSDKILRFRDESYIKYHTNPLFLKRIQKKYGDKAAINIKNMASIRLKRKILGD
jgi:radical SAM superfamily enzyme YgiQ (UPF0313 family)